MGRRSIRRGPGFAAKVFVVVSLLLLSSAWVLNAQNSTQPRTGYLDKRNDATLSVVLPPAPKKDDARDQTDRAIFRSTRSMNGTPRWTLAQKDDGNSPAALLRAFSCSVGAQLTPQNVPKLNSLINRTSVDSWLINDSVKSQFQRKRPFVGQEAALCIVPSKNFAQSYDYPSGHATVGWLTGLILADIAPDRAAEILLRARAYGDSRIVCGVHNASSVEAGRLLGAAIFVELDAQAAFRTDLAAAKVELDKLLSSRSSKDAATCSAERSLALWSPYESLPSAQDQLMHP